MYRRRLALVLADRAHQPAMGRATASFPPSRRGMVRVRWTEATPLARVPSTSESLAGLCSFPLHHRPVRLVSFRPRRSPQEGRHPVRLRIEVRRRRVRPDRGRHALEEAPAGREGSSSPSRCRTSATGAADEDAPRARHADRDDEGDRRQGPGRRHRHLGQGRAGGRDSRPTSTTSGSTSPTSRPTPRGPLPEKARTQTVSEIPHVYVKEALDRLYGRTEPVAAAPDPKLQERWEKAPNLVKGDFEQGRGAPAGLGSPAPRRDLGRREGQGRKVHAKKLIRFTMNEEVAGTTGVLYYSAFFPVEEGATYRFQCRWRPPARPPRCSSSATTSCRPSSATARAATRTAQDREARGLPQPAESPGSTRASGTSRPRISRPSTPSTPRGGGA